MSQTSQAHWPGFEPSGNETDKVAMSSCRQMPLRMAGSVPSAVPRYLLGNVLLNITSYFDSSLAPNLDAAQF